ncbi:hypothetical protein P7M22_26885 [Vibrio parahaemolyticus]|nr:hypothetical protein [Vibrio parahaemolyticus]
MTSDYRVLPINKSRPAM